MENTVQPDQELENSANLKETEPQKPEATEPVAEVKQDPANDVKKLQDELAEAKDKYLRLYAEFDNFRRRTAKERIELIQSAGEQLLKALLPVADDFDRAEKSFAGKTDKEAEGFFLIQNKFKKILEQNSVKVMDTSNGEFNPDIHDAITQVPAPDEKSKGKIVDVVEKGYLLNDKVIRHAKVVVGS
jgi:molecular chaperone GrpE